MFATRRLLQLSALASILALGSAADGAEDSNGLRGTENTEINDAETTAPWQPSFLDKQEVETGALSGMKIGQKYYEVIDTALEQTFEALMNGLVHQATIRMTNEGSNNGNDDDDTDGEIDDGELKKWYITITGEDLDSYFKNTNEKTRAYSHTWKSMSDSPFEPLGVVDNTSFRAMVSRYAKDHGMNSLKIKFTRDARVRTVRFMNFLASQSIGLGQMKMNVDQSQGRRELQTDGTDSSIVDFILQPFSGVLATLTNPFTIICIASKFVTGNIGKVIDGCKILSSVPTVMLEAGNATGWDYTFLATEDFAIEGADSIPGGPNLYVNVADIEMIADELGFEVPPEALETVADFTNSLYTLFIQALVVGGFGGINAIIGLLVPAPFAGLVQAVPGTIQKVLLDLLLPTTDTP